MLQEKGFAKELMYEHRQYHFDVVSGMDHATLPFISHQRRIRDALRNGTHELQECSAPRSNQTVFGKEVREKLLASMPDPFAHVKDGWKVVDDREFSDYSDENWACSKEPHQGREG